MGNIDSEEKYELIMNTFEKLQTQMEKNMGRGKYTKDENHKPYRKLNHNHFNTLIEDIDFELNIDGTINKKDNRYKL